MTASPYSLRSWGTRSRSCEEAATTSADGRRTGEASTATAPLAPIDLRVRLADGQVGLRQLRVRDGSRWIEIRERNAAWLAPWEVTPSGRIAPEAPSWRVYLTALRRLREQAAAGTALPLAVTLNGRLVGQVTAGSITGPPGSSAYVGYWIDRAVAGRGVMPTALALVVDYCFDVLRLRRIEANIRPENIASRRVVDKLGFRPEQLRTRYLHVAGQWRDHICYVVTPEDVPEGMVARWHGARRTYRA